MIEILDKIAQERFGEFGFATCSIEEQLIIIKEVKMLCFMVIHLILLMKILKK